MYALFSQQKLVYQGLLGAAQTELMNITHQHEDLALRDTGLKSKLSSIQEYYATQKSDLYDELTHSLSDSDCKIITGDDTNGTKKTGHVRTYETDGNGNKTPVYYSKYEWTVLTSGLEENYENIKDSYTTQDLESIGVRTREAVERELTELDQQLSAEEARLNKQIDETARKETRLDTEKASIETKITDYQKQLEKIEEAEGKGIEASIGKFQGVG